MSRLDHNLVMGPEAFLTQKTAEVEGDLAKGIFKTFFIANATQQQFVILLSITIITKNRDQTWTVSGGVVVWFPSLWWFKVRQYSGRQYYSFNLFLLSRNINKEHKKYLILCNSQDT